MKPALTPKQSAVFDFMKSFHEVEDRLPSTHEIQAFIGCASQTAALNHVQILCRKGYLEHRNAGSRKRGWWRFGRNENCSAFKIGQYVIYKGYKYLVCDVDEGHGILALDGDKYISPNHELNRCTEARMSECTIIKLNAYAMPPEGSESAHCSENQPE